MVAARLGGPREFENYADKMSAVQGSAGVPVFIGKSLSGDPEVFLYPPGIPEVALIKGLQSRNC